MKYKKSIIFSRPEIEVLKKQENFEQTFSLPNGLPIYPNVKISEYGVGYERTVRGVTYVIKEFNEVLYLWRITENIFCLLKPNDYHADTFCNDYTDESLKELEMIKDEIKSKCLRESELAIELGVIDESNALIIDYYGVPLFERLDRYVKEAL